MDATIKITESGKSIKVESPYHPRFVAFAKKRQAKWAKPCWVFDARDREDVEAALRRHYGTAGEAVPLCDARWTLDAERFYGTSLCELGRVVATRASRDYSVKLGDGVVLIKGGFPSSGGSVKNPDLEPKEGTVLEVRDVPLALAKALASEESGVEIVREHPFEAAGADASPGVARAEALSRIRGLIAEHGFTAEEIAPLFF